MQELIQCFLKRWGVWLLLAFALLYYGQYYRAGLYPAAEGGVEGMVALRLMAGWRPIVDTFLGYNLLWFYPIVALFKIFGPSYTVLRLFFFVLSTITGILSFRLVLKCTGAVWLSFLAAFLVLVIPGQMFRNYMAFIVVLNMTTLLSAFVLPASNMLIRLGWMAGSGITLAIAWLIRVDVGFFLSCIWLGLVLTYPIRGDGIAESLRNAKIAMIGALFALMTFLLTHLPFYLDASKRGFEEEFVAQYQQWPAMIQFQGHRMFDAVLKSTSGWVSPTPKATPSQVVSSAVPVVTPDPEKSDLPVVAPPKKSESLQASQTTLARRSFQNSSARDRMLAINLYLPVLLSVILGLTGLTGWIIALARQEEDLRVRALLLLTTLGCSLTLFPQYFFWRPDMVHLSEFMVPMTLTLLIACFALGSTWKTWNALPKIRRVFSGLFLVLSMLTLLLYYINACQSQASGGIAASVKKHLEFRAAHGVNVKLTPSEYADADAIYKIVHAVSSHDEYLICYPYNPEINFMTDRPSYEYNFYIDNAMIPAERFHQETLAKIAKFHPAAFVITNWPINNTEESEFKNWASKTYDYIVANYKLAYQHGNVEVFVRPDRAGGLPLATPR